jgi:hypothetical protein
MGQAGAAWILEATARPQASGYRLPGSLASVPDAL